MRITHIAMQAAYTRSIGENHHASRSRVPKNAHQQHHYTSRLTTKNKTEKPINPIAFSVAIIACLALVSNLYYTDCPKLHRRGTKGEFAATTKWASMPQYRLPIGVNAPQPRCTLLSFAHITPMSRMISVASQTLKKINLSLIPTAYAHISPKLTTSSPHDADSDIAIRRMNFECVHERETLSLSQILRQIGTSLEKPITSLAKESQVINHLMTLQIPCPSEEESTNLTAITQNTDTMLSNIVGMFPHSLSLSALQNIGGPLLQLIADKMDERPLDQEKLADVGEQIIFLQRSIIDFSPLNEKGQPIPERLTLPKNIALENKKIMTQIQGKSWQLSYDKGHYIASSDDEQRNVIYSVEDKEWQFIPEKTVIKSNEAHIGHENQSPHIDSPEMNIASPLIKKNEVLPHSIVRQETQRLGAGDSGIDLPIPVARDNQIASSNNPTAIKPRASDSGLAQREKTRLLPLNARISPHTLQEIHALGAAGINSAGGLHRVAQQKNVPLKVLIHFIRSDGTLTKRGRHLLTPIPKNMDAMLINRLHKMGKDGIIAAGGWNRIAQTENIPVHILRHFIRKNGSLTTKGKLLVSEVNKSDSVAKSLPKRRKLMHEATEQKDALAASQQSAEKLPQSATNEDLLRIRQGERGRDLAETGPSQAQSPDRTHSEQALSPISIASDKEILRLITRQSNEFSNVVLVANVAGERKTLLYNIEHDIFFIGGRNHKGKWQRISDTPYIAQAGAEELTALTTETERIVTEAQRTASLKALGCNLDLPAIAHWTSQYHRHKEIPRVISSVWVGNKVLPWHLLKTLRKNANLAQSSVNFYDFTLYLSRRYEGVYQRNKALLKTHAPLVKVVALENIPFFQTFSQSKYYEQYDAAITGNGGVATNFASAADILRFQLLEAMGGIYMDVDDTLVAPPGNVRLIAPPDGFVLSSPMSNPQLGMLNQYPTSIFGTHKNNPTLLKVSEKIYDRYQTNKDIYQSRPPLDDTERFSDYSKRISYLTGPGVFDTVIRESRYEENQVLEAHRFWQLPLDDNFETLMQTPVVKTLFTLLSSDIIKLSEIVNVGGENSWRYNR